MKVGLPPTTHRVHQLNLKFFIVESQEEAGDEILCSKLIINLIVVIITGSHS